MLKMLIRLKKQFRQLLEDNNNICPGKSLNEVAIFFLGRECFTSLSEKDKQEIYEEHQRALKDRAKRDFQELLLENAEMFMKFEHVMVTNDDITEVNQRLQQEPRSVRGHSQSGCLRSVRSTVSQRLRATVSLGPWS